MQAATHKITDFSKAFNHFFWKAKRHGIVPDYDQTACGDMVYTGNTHFFLIERDNKKGQWIALTYHTDHRNRETAYLRVVSPKFDMPEYLDEFGL